MIIIRRYCPTHQSTTRAFSRNMEMYVIDSCVRHHVSKHFWTPTIGETLVYKREPDNPTDVYAVAVMVNSIVVGHVPRKISAACSLFLRRNGSTLHCTITAD